jgi:hypothetical protein
MLILAHEVGALRTRDLKRVTVGHHRAGQGQPEWLQNWDFSGRQQAKEQSSCSEWTGVPL